MSRKKYDGHPGKSRFNSFLLYLFGNYFMRLLYKIHYEGADRMNKKGPVLLLAKHQRYDDIPLGLAVVHGRCRTDVWCVMKDSLAKWYFFGFFIKCGGIPINRKNPEKSKKFLMLARHVLYDGNVVAMFPEQTYVPAKMGKGRTPRFSLHCRKTFSASCGELSGFSLQERLHQNACFHPNRKNGVLRQTPGSGHVPT